jgi:Flp pilus assembly protein TadB
MQPQAETRSSTRSGSRQQTDIGAPSPSPGYSVQPDVIYQGGEPVHQSRSFGAQFVMLLAVIAVIGLVAWIVAGAVFALLHVIEIVVVAGVAGWAGYRLGHYRGRKSRA